MSEWQPIATAPKDGTRILIAEGDVICTAEWDGRTDQTKWPNEWKECWIASPASGDTYERFEFEPTHWMPLPPPPALGLPPGVTQHGPGQFSDVVQLSPGSAEEKIRKALGGDK